MTTKKSAGTSEIAPLPPTLGTGSVAHQIIGEFLSQLEQQDGYAPIAKKLRRAALDMRPTEISIRKALFDEEPL